MRLSSYVRFFSVSILDDANSAVGDQGGGRSEGAWSPLSLSSPSSTGSGSKYVHIIQEIIETEKTYVHDLNDVIEVLTSVFLARFSRFITFGRHFDRVTKLSASTLTYSITTTILWLCLPT